MSLPTTPADLPYPPGDVWSVRNGAGDIRSTLEQLRTARAAAIRIEDIAGGAHWRGAAFEAFARVIEREPLRLALHRAHDRMTQAADRLDWFADRFEANTDTIRWCRSRLAALGIEGGQVPDELVPEVQRIQWDAERAWHDHRASLQSVTDLFDWLDDQPTFATPPPSNWDRVRGAAGHVWSFGVGVVEATWDMAAFAAELMVWINPLTGPFKWHEAWENREQIRFLLQYAWDNPGEFAFEVGKAIIDLDTWREDGVARWLGHRVPDIVLALATGGLGSVGSGAATSVRALRGGRVLASRATRIATRLNRLGADVARLDGITELGALARTDTAIGRLRQVPGLVNDEIKGVAQLPFRGQLSPTLQRRFDSVVTNGLTGRLGIIDGLLVGAPALSPETKTAMAGVLGISVVDDLGTTVSVGADVAGIAAAAAAEEDR